MKAAGTVGRFALLGLSLVSAIAGLIVWLAEAPSVGGGILDVVMQAMVPLANSAWWFVGTVIVLRTRAGAIGWTLVLAALFGGLAMAGFASASRMLDGGEATPGRIIGFLAVSLSYGPWFGNLLLGAMVLFPDGRLPGPRWRLPVAALIAAITVSGLSRVVAPGPLFRGLPDNPIGITALDWLPFGLLAALDPLGLMLLALLGLAAMVVRFRRADPLVRRQLKWLLIAVVPAALATPISFFEPNQTSTSPADVVQAAALFLLMPASIGLAITRYRLYEIDRLISRGVSWGLLTAALVGVYAGAVLLLQGVLTGATQGQTLAVAASTLLAAALFQPLRRRIQAVVDRRFDRARYDAERTGEAFAGRLRDQHDLVALRGELTTVIDETVRPLAAAVWLRNVQNDSAPEVS